MILTRLAKIQLTVIGVLFVIGLLVMGQVFLRVPETLGVGRYTVTASFSDGAGLYPGAEVTYLGDPVGKVTHLAIAHPGVTVTMSVEKSADVPRQITANIHSLSAVGEQYVDLVPTKGATAARALGAGDAIPMADTSIPVQIPQLLDDTDKLLTSVPTRRLNQLLHETGTALRGRDADLQNILDRGHHFIDTASANLGPTQQLIRQFAPLSDAITSTGGNVRRYTRNLALVTKSLRQGDGYLRAILDDAPDAAADTAALLHDLDPVIAPLLHQLGVVSEVLATYNGGLAEILTDYPSLTAAVQSVTLPFTKSHQVALDVANINDPVACIKGFLPPDQQRPPSQTGLAKTPYLHCDLSPSAPTVVKGARNLPCERYPGYRAATPAECRREATGR